MYHEHFGLTEAPFKITPDTRLFFPGGSRGAILDAIVYAIVNGEGIVKVVGEVGSGKTMLCRMLEVKLPESVEVVYLANPSLSADDILHAVAFEMALPLPPGAGRLEVMHALHARLLEKHAADRQVVVFVEEAQRMPLDTLEEIRLLSNLETERHKLLQIVLFGQPELDRNLRPAHIRQLKERITHSFFLPRLTAEEIREYLDFRMRNAGYRGPSLFAPAAVGRIAKASQGLIRRVNILADKSLLAAYSMGVHEVTPRHVKVAVRDSEFGARAWEVDWRLAGAFGAGIAATALAWALHVGFVQWPPPAPPGAADGVAVAGPVTRRSEPRPDTGAATAGEGAVASVVGAGGGPSAPAQVAPGSIPAEAPERLAAVSSPQPAPAPGEGASAAQGGSVGGAADAPAPAEVLARAEPPDRAAGPPASAGPAGSESDPEPPGEAPRERDVESARLSYLDRRLAATEAWLSSPVAAPYSIQLMHIGVDRGGGLEASLRQSGLEAQMDRVWIYRTRIRGESLLSVLLGEFASQEDARRAIEGLPARLQQARPFVRSLKDIRSSGLAQATPGGA